MRDLDSWLTFCFLNGFKKKKDNAQEKEVECVCSEILKKQG